MAGGMETLARFACGEEAAVDGVFAGIVDAVGDAEKVGVDGGELEVVVDLVEQIAEGGGVAIAGADEAGELGGEFLLDGFFEDGAAHDGAGGEEAIEVAAGGFVEVAIGFFRAGSGDSALAQPGGAQDRGLDELKKLKDKGGAEQLVLLGVEGALNGLPGGRGRVRRLKARERSEALPRVLDKALMHFAGKLAPVGDEGGGVVAKTGAELVVEDGRKDATKLREAPGAGELGDGIAEVAAGGVFLRLEEELLFELGNVQGHRFKGRPEGGWGGVTEGTKGGGDVPHWEGKREWQNGKADVCAG
jgi:hypothetical protein